LKICIGPIPTNLKQDESKIGAQNEGDERRVREQALERTAKRCFILCSGEVGSSIFKSLSFAIATSSKGLPQRV
jgi:hypothetical protein